MSREAWRLIKRSKRFYVNTYRRAGTVLIFSMLINVLFGLGIYYTYFNRSAPDFYATSGITPPVMLSAMTAPNMKSVPLLANEPENNNNDEKVIPQ